MSSSEERICFNPLTRIRSSLTRILAAIGQLSGTLFQSPYEDSFFSDTDIQAAKPQTPQRVSIPLRGFVLL